MNMRRAYLYFLLFLVICAFAYREVGGIVGRTYGVSILPEGLKWIEEIDQFIFFFSDRGGDVYSMINWSFILGAFLFVGLLRTLRRVKPPDLTIAKDKIIEEGENPFSVIAEWKREVKKK